MASSSCIPSSSSSSATQWEVFLSFHGKDTREKFVDHLYTALYQKGIPTFKDDEKLERGRPIGPELLKAIEESRYSVVVLSENYASSRWCLDELVHILHSCSCRNTAMGRQHSTIYPVFYHVDPSNVRHQDGIFGEGFAKAASKHGEEKAQKWREALKEVANLAGWEYPSNQYRSESKFIQELVGKICCEGEGIYASVTEDLVGIHSRMEKVIQLLGLGLDDHAHAVGIWGMGGIGKSTIAREVCHRICHQFEAFSYLENVREVSTRSGLATLQQQLISDILGPKDMEIRNTFIGERMIRNRVCNKKVLVVVDDVDQLEQLENLVGKLDRFNVGSRIIITTRDKQLLVAYDVKDIYEVEMLDEDESIQLFISKAFGNKDQQTRVFKDLVKHTARYAGGVPLALKVLGASLKGKRESEWKSALNKLKEWPDQKVLQVLKISYDALHWTEKQIFLDIACFLKGQNITLATQILDSCGFYAEIGISILVDKSLISFENNRVWMHDLIQELGWNIVCQESRDPGERNRLWLYNDVYHVLMNNTGTKAVESIILQFSEKNELLNLGAKAFAKMTKLRLLKICNVQLPNGLKYLSNELRYLNWDGYPLKRTPQTFRPKHLVELHLSDSYLEQLWDGKLLLPNLRIMNFRNLTNLTKCPDLTEAPELESVMFVNCKSLVDVHQSVGALTKLNQLYLLGCRNLRSLPTGIDCKSLEFLALGENSKLLKFPKILGKTKSLKELSFTGTGAAQLFSVGHLPNLNSLKLTGCVDLESLPSKLDFESLRTLDLSGCPKLMNIPEIFGNMKRLEKLQLQRTGTIELPLSVGHLDNLIELDLSHCQNLKSLPDCICQLKALKKLLLIGCSNLEKLPSSAGAHPIELKHLCIDGCKKITSDLLNSFLSFSLSRKSLYFLDMGECNLKSVPTAICSFCSLACLKLKGNDFARLPAGMNQLSRLWCLNLEGCKRLEELPELTPTLTWIHGSDCQSLRSILSPSTYKSLHHFDFSNCNRLLGNERILDVLLSTASQRYVSSWINNNPCNIEIAFLGSKIPKWFSHDKVELHPTNRRSLGCATCAVIEIEETYEPCDQFFNYTTPAQINIADRLFLQLSSQKQWRPTDTETLWITFGELCLPEDELDRLNKLGGSEFATFTITPRGPGFNIKSCGLRVWFQDDDFCDQCIYGTQAVEKQEEKDNDDVVVASMPKRRRLDNVDDDDEEEEEKDRHTNNKIPGQFFEPIAMDLDLNEEETVGPSGSRSLEEKKDPSMDPQPRI